MNDLFAPVSKEELEGLKDTSDNNIFSPLSAEEKAFADTLGKDDAASPSRLESFARGATQGVTFGFGDELSGKISALSPSLRSTAQAIDSGVADTISLQKQSKLAAGDRLNNIGQIIKEMQAEGASKGDILKQVMFLKDQAGQEIGNESDMLYEVYRDRERRANAAAQEANPLTYLGGEVLAGVAAGGPATKLAGGSAKALAGVLAAEGGLMGLGASDEEDAVELAKDAGKGALTGLATQGVMGAAGKVLGGLRPSSLRSLAEDRAVKAVTGQNISGLRKIAGTTLKDAGDVERAMSNVRRAGRDMLDENLISRFDTVEDIAPKVSMARKAQGEAIEGISRGIDEAKPNSVDAQKIANEIAEFAESIPGTEAGKKLQERLYAEAANFEKMGSMSFKDAQAFKNQFAHKPVDADALISNQDATNRIKKIIGGNMDEAAERAGRLKEYMEAKRKYGSFKNASSAATDRVQKNLTNRFISPSDYGVGSSTALLSALSSGGGSSSSHVVFGLLGAMANKLGRQKGSSFAAKTADDLAKAFEKSPELLKKFGDRVASAAQKGPAALGAMHYILSQQNPEYQQAVTLGRENK